MRGLGKQPEERVLVAQVGPATLSLSPPLTLYGAVISGLIMSHCVSEAIKHDVLYGALRGGMVRDDPFLPPPLTGEEGRLLKRAT